MIIVPPVPGKYARSRAFLGHTQSKLYLILSLPNQHT